MLMNLLAIFTYELLLEQYIYLEVTVASTYIIVGVVESSLYCTSMLMKDCDHKPAINRVILFTQALNFTQKSQLNHVLNLQRKKVDEVLYHILRYFLD